MQIADSYYNRVEIYTSLRMPLGSGLESEWQ